MQAYKHYDVTVVTLFTNHASLQTIQFTFYIRWETVAWYSFIYTQTVEITISCISLNTTTGQLIRTYATPKYYLKHIIVGKIYKHSEQLHISTNNKKQN